MMSKPDVEEQLAIEDLLECLFRSIYQEHGIAAARCGHTAVIQ